MLENIVLEFSMVSNERLYGLLLTDSMKIKGIARYYSLFSHIKNLGKIAKKKAIKLFYDRFKHVKSYIDYIFLSRRKEIIVSELRRLSLKFFEWFDNIRYKFRN